MSSRVNEFVVRDFSHPDLACGAGHAAHDTTHTSGLPIEDEEIACWPDKVEVVGGHYAKRVTTVAQSGSFSSLRVPLFNRRRLSVAEPLIPSLYLSEVYKASHALADAHRWSVFQLAELIPAVNDKFLQSLDMPMSAQNPYWTWSCDGTTFFIDTASVLELVVAQDEPIFRLLMSPFRDMAVQAKQSAEEAAICYVNDNALTPRGGSFRKVGAPNWRSLEDATCIAFWLLSEPRRAELSLCANSIRMGGTLRIPRADISVMASVHGYERGSNLLVKSVQAIESTPTWPCSWSTVTVLNKRLHAGRVASVPPLLRRPEGTFRQGRASVRQLDLVETKRKLQEFEGRGLHHKV
jgi:hypothetical protein